MGGKSLIAFKWQKSTNRTYKSSEININGALEIILVDTGCSLGELYLHFHHKSSIVS